MLTTVCANTCGSDSCFIILDSTAMSKSSIPQAPPLSEDIKTSKPVRQRTGVRKVSSTPPVDPAIAEAEKARKEAFDAVHRWRGKVLLPFTISRESLFYSLRVHAGAPPLSSVAKSASAFLGDALRILFLCSHAPEEWEHVRDEPVMFLRAIDAWADKNVSRSEMATAVKVSLRIFNDADSNRADPVARDDSAVGE